MDWTASIVPGKLLMPRWMITVWEPLIKHRSKAVPSTMTLESVMNVRYA